ncbi:MAG TPA: hypothetical protein VFM19_01360 [Candidatus Limnocylindria bacterium]|nr:hypothetical protein [Candidatus Limnocylindria bacterium]
MPERPAPLVLVVDPSRAAADAAFGSYAAVAATGQRLLAGELAERLGAQGAAVAPLLPARPPAGGQFHWGRWYVARAREALDGAAGPVDALGYAGAGALALLSDVALDQLLSPLPGEVVGNNRFSADAFVVAGDLPRALAALEACPTDNAAVRALEAAGFAARGLRRVRWSRFDVDTPLDLALLRTAATIPGARRPSEAVVRFLAMAQLPGGRGLEVPHLDALGAVLRDRDAELVVAGRVPAAALAFLESETACRTRAFVEERGMRSAREGEPRSLLASLMDRTSPAELIGELTALGDAVVLDTRVLMAARGGSADAATWPPEEERFASDFGDHARVATPWLGELTRAAAAASVPVLLGGHALVSDGLRILTGAAWLGR